MTNDIYLKVVCAHFLPTYRGAHLTPIGWAPFDPSIPQTWYAYREHYRTLADLVRGYDLGSYYGGFRVADVLDREATSSPEELPDTLFALIGLHESYEVCAVYSSQAAAEEDAEIRSAGFGEIWIEEVKREH